MTEIGVQLPEIGVQLRPKPVFNFARNRCSTSSEKPTRSSRGGSARAASLRNLFARQAIQMAWDYGEENPFSDSGGGYSSTFGWIEPAIRFLLGTVPGTANVADAASQNSSRDRMISTDPLYYDNIGYADLSDFFYIWLRRSLQRLFPDLFATLAVPKTEERHPVPPRQQGGGGSLSSTLTA